jgi:biofilm PGA synthesis protein PgaD
MSELEQKIIDAPELLTRRARFRDTVATGVLWGVYVYLWVPVISLLAWWLGFEFGYDVMVRAGGAEYLKTVLLDYGLIVGGIFIVVTLWSFSNRQRFRGGNRRKLSAGVSDSAMAQTFGVDLDRLALLRAEQIVHATFDDQGRLQPVAMSAAVPSPVNAVGGDEGGDQGSK